MNNLTTKHTTKVTRIKASVTAIAKSGRQAKMFHGSTNSTRPPVDPDLAMIDVSDLDEILEINTVDNYVVVEPNVPLDKLVKYTTKFGLVPPVVAEFPGITVGGAVQGGSGESSSHKYGLLSDICTGYEVILGNGERVVCTRRDHADLFHGLSCAFGSLGVVTAVRIKLVRATKYVRLTYLPTGNATETIATVKAQVAQGFEFVDAIQFSKTSGVVVVGEYAIFKKGRAARFTRFWDEWFYLHVEQSLARGVTEEYTPLADYLFRYDRGGFWVAKYGFSGEHIKFTRTVRVLMAGFFKTRTLFKLLHTSGYAYKYMAQDVCLPQQSVEKFLKYNDETTQVYPLWICPLKPTKTDKLAPTALKTKLVINVGIWGALSPSRHTFRARNRDMERAIATLGGRKVLYAHAYYTTSEFWNIYDKKWYDSLRKKYQATVIFPDVHRKTLTKPATTAPSRRRALLGLLVSPYKRTQR